MAMKKKRGKRKGAAPPPLKRGRKKELKRFEMETWHTTEMDQGVGAAKVAANEVAFVVRTSGGTPLNASDVKKLFRALQHEIRSLGHHLKRKGQPLDPKPKEAKEPKEAAPEQPTEETASEPAPEPAVSDDGPEDEEAQTSADYENADHADTEPDPDDSDPETTITT